MRYSTILHIDDDSEDLEIFSTALEVVSQEAKYTGINNAREALQLLEVKQIIPEVIFLDINMPLMNGLEFLAKIKNNSGLKSIPVIIFSTSSNDATVSAAKELGAFDFITKPNKFDELVSILSKLI